MLGVPITSTRTGMASCGILRPCSVSVSLIAAAMEASAATQVALNFDAAPVYGQADYGHFSPAASYDAARDRVLVLDVDRNWHEPYWVPVDIMLTALATLSRKDGSPRGYLKVTLAG